MNNVILYNGTYRTLFICYVKLLWVVQKHTEIARRRSRHMNLNDLNLVNDLIDKELFDMFRKENLSTSSTVNNDEGQQVTDNETEMQIDTPFENVTDVLDESEESTHDPNDSSNYSEEDKLEIQDESVTIENNNQERKSVDGRSFLKVIQSHEH